MLEAHDNFVKSRLGDQEKKALYSAPELLIKGAKFSEKVDIWSIGVLTYKLLTNK